jgi:hypothetical protein
MNEEGDASIRLPDNLLALPIWAVVSSLTLLGTGVALGFAFLLTPGLTDTERTAGSELLLFSLPVLALAIGLIGASWARTERIDSMATTFLNDTVGKKLAAYLIGNGDRTKDGRPYPPLFVRIERFVQPSITSFCYYHLFDEHQRRFDILVKSNVFNFELAYYLRLAQLPKGFSPDCAEQSYDLESLKSWASVVRNPLVDLVASTIHGSISEGYTVYIQADTKEDGTAIVTYRLRQKIQTNFLTSPYVRRYFSEDAAIASYYFYSEAFSNGGELVIGGVTP